MRQRERVPMHHARQQHRLLQIADVAPDAAPGARAEGDEIRLQLLGAVGEPALRPVDFGLREDAFVAVRHVGGHGDGGVAGDEGVEDGGAGGGGAAGEAEGRGRVDAEGFVEAGAEVGQVLHFVVGGDGFGGGEDGVDFGAEFVEAGGVFEEEVHGVVHGDGGRVGAGVHWGIS